MSLSDRAAGALDFLLTDRRVPWVLAAGFFALGSVFAVTDYTLNDEGLFTFMSADQTRYAFNAIFFFQKSKPVLSLLYWLPVLGGLTPFFVAHTLVAALAIPMAAATARAMKILTPNVPAFILAFSPLYLFGAPAGLANTDGVAGVVVALWLLLALQRPFLAGVVLGTLPWMRSELALFCAMLVLPLSIGQRNGRLLLGTAVFPVVYWLWGTTYHHDLLWILHYPPSTVQPPPVMAHNPLMPIFHRKATVSNVLPFLLAVSPAVPLFFVLRRTGMALVEIVLVVHASVWIVLATVLPAFEIANFGFVPRYILPILPAVALLGGRAVGEWWQSGRAGLRWIFFAALYGASLGFTYVHSQENRAVWMLALAGGVTAWALRTRRTVVVSATLLGILAGPYALPTQVSRQELAEYLPATERWLREHPSDITGPLFTNSMLLGPYLSRHASDLRLDIRYLMPVDSIAEAYSLVNPNSRQKEEGLAALYKSGLPGAKIVWSEGLKPTDLPPGSLFLFRPHDDRIQLTLPTKIWESHLQSIAQAGCQIFRLAP
jgi:hypothetical protein